MRKGKDPDPEPELDLGGPKTCVIAYPDPDPQHCLIVGSESDFHSEHFFHSYLFVGPE
jgi:hypothetical protein